MKRLFSPHKLLNIAAISLILLSGLSAFTPVALSATRMLHLVTLLAVFLLIAAHLVVFLKPRRHASLAVLGIIAVIGIFASFGGRQPDPDSLRQTYVTRLVSFSGTPFVWGGEGKRGIDCSGLARTAFLQAMAVRGIQDANPRLLGPMLWKFWWSDVSAKALLESAHRYTVAIGRSDRLSLENGIKMNPGFTLRAGDLAVTGNGGHVMIYIGRGEWIEASPQDMEVVANQAVNTRRGYFNTPVTIMRWWLLED